MKRIVLDNRLLAIASMVREGSIMADVGTDHGLLVGYLAQNDIIKKGYACDINQGPLDAAIETVIEHGLAHIIEPVLTNGLIGLEDKGITDIVIAGMGGQLISEILEDAQWTNDPRISLVLQPMTRDFQLRRYLYRLGFEIQHEQAIVQGDRVYVIMQCRFADVYKEISLEEAWIGKLWDNNDNDTNTYYKRRMKTLIKMEPSFHTKEAGYPELLKKIRERLD